MTCPLASLRRTAFLNISKSTSEACCQRVKEKNNSGCCCSFLLPGGDLLSQDPAVQVPSTLESLTSVFGMGTGVTSPSLPPDYEGYQSFSVRSSINFCYIAAHTRSNPQKRTSNCKTFICTFKTAYYRKVCLLLRF